MNCEPHGLALNPFSGEVKVIRGQGMPSYRHHDFGNLYIQFEVKFPPVLTRLLPESEDYDPSAQQNLEDVLGPRKEQPIPDKDAMVEDFALEDIDPSNQRRAHGANAMDEDDEDGVPHGAERMQCASQ